MKDEIFDEAEKYMKNPDLVIDLFDLSIVWMNDRTKKLLEYTDKDVQEKTVTDIFGYDKEETRKALSEDIKKHGFRDMTAKTKSGKKFQMKAEFHNFEFKGGFYRAAKRVSGKRGK